MLFSSELVAAATDLLDRCRIRGLHVCCAESCTGGLVAALLTEIAGASDVVDCGFVTYSNAAKSALLGVPERLIDEHGAVSAPVARAMAEGALARSGSDLAVAITGIAGPGGGSAGKPVGLVWFGLAVRDGESHAECRHFGAIGRGEVRLASLATALDLLGRNLAANGDDFTLV